MQAPVALSLTLLLPECESDCECENEPEYECESDCECESECEGQHRIYAPHGDVRVTSCGCERAGRTRRCC